jgi:zinc transporter, ZIP family
MPGVLSAFLVGGLAAASLLLGYYLAMRGISEKTTGIIMGIGSGALISAIAYELVPESVLTGLDVILALGLGALVFYGGDWLVDHWGGADRKDIAGSQAKGSGAAIFIGTLLDNLPESAILGMSLGLGGSINFAFLIAVFISNLPEGVAGTFNLKASGISGRKIFWLWGSLVLLSAAFAGLGYILIQWLPGIDGLYVQAFAAGAMLTMLSDAMIPEAYQHGGKTVGLFTVLGFIVTAVLSAIQ